jgi:hypothetical protein
VTVTCLSSPAPRPHAHPWPRLPPRPPRRCCRALRTNRHKSTIAYDKSYNNCLRVVSWFHGFMVSFHGFMVLELGRSRHCSMAHHETLFHYYNS